MKIKTINSLFVIFLTFSLSSQISVTNTQTPSDLIQNVLLGTGVNATNIKYNGSSVNALSTQVNATYFNSGSTSFPIADGVLISSGAGIGAVGPNNASSQTNSTGTSVVVDADMSAITPNTITNGVVLEFDFVATGDSVSFEYLFGSEEYPSDFGASFYDVFGFFLSGPGFTGPYSNGGVNLATLPGTTTSISILNLNPTNNATYYVDNTSGLSYGNSIQYDGTSIVMKAGAHLICGQTYHMKLGVSNVGDEAYDTGVFLKGGSFSADVIKVQATNNLGAVIDSITIEEGCSSIDISFIRPLSFLDTMQVFHIQTSGDVNLTTDLSNYIDSVVFNIGVDTVLFTINPINDGIVEPTELVQLMVFTITPCGDTLYDSVRVYIVDPIKMVLSSTPATCMPDGSATALAVGNIGPAIYSWTGPSPNVTDTVHTATYNNISSGWYVMTLEDDQCVIKDSVFVSVLNPPQAIISTLNDSGSAPTSFVFFNSSTNATNYAWNFDNGMTTTSSDLSNQSSDYPLSGEYTIQLIAFAGLCSDTAYKTVYVVDEPVLDPTNIFTPNGDGVNDQFHLKIQNVKQIEMTIVDRWGVIVYGEVSVNPKWDGTYNGEKLPDGVYFYKYKATGINGKIIEGQEFVHLIR